MLLPPKWRRVFSVLKPVCQPSQALRHQEANLNYEVVVPSTLSPVLCCFPGTGCPVTETTVIVKVEQGQEPWIVEGENSCWSSPGESEKTRKMGVFEIGVPVGEGLAPLKCFLGSTYLWKWLGALDMPSSDPQMTPSVPLSHMAVLSLPQLLCRRTSCRSGFDSSHCPLHRSACLVLSIPRILIVLSSSTWWQIFPYI